MNQAKESPTDGGASSDLIPFFSPLHVSKGSLDRAAMKLFDIGQLIKRKPAVGKQLVTQVSNLAQCFTMKGEVNMVRHSLGSINDTNYTRLQLQLFLQFTRDRSRGLFIAIKPSTGQAPRQARVISVFDQQHKSIIVEDYSGNAKRIARLRPAEQAVGYAHYDWESAKQMRNLPCHWSLFARLRTYLSLD
ncbi:MAG: hypothetical protein OXG84_03615 [Chloroflexi bacterium]|nr:hypothetical protein [Chloroflexota bacterium]